MRRVQNATRMAALSVVRRVARQMNFDLVYRDFYSPLPDLRALPADFFSRASSLPGVSWNAQGQLGFFEDLLPHIAEFDSPAAARVRSASFTLPNGGFEGLDPLVLFAMVRALRPARVVEVGSGSSALVTASAVALNWADGHPCRFESFDPFPAPYLRESVTGLSKLADLPAQAIPPDTLFSLRQNDILFIDTTHTVKAGSEVNYLLLEVLPRLAPGVVVHLHDIFLPWEYPRPFLYERAYFWGEQYLVQALLGGSQDFDVLLANHWLARTHRCMLRAKLHGGERSYDGGSLWLRRAR